MRSEKIPKESKERVRLKIDSWGLSDRGRRRPVNEDAVYHRTVNDFNGQPFGLYLVCDGLGGHQAGDVASDLAVDVISRKLEGSFLEREDENQLWNPLRQPLYAIRSEIEDAIQKSNQAILDYTRLNPRVVRKPGTTVSLAMIYHGVAYIANVGDSRVYIWRRGELHQITQDHSLVGNLLQKGVISKDELNQHPKRNVITRALGTDDIVEVDIFEWEIQPGDKLLLCTDGLWNAFPNDVDIKKWLDSVPSPRDLCIQLTADANRRDGRDNIGVVVVAISALDPALQERLEKPKSSKMSVETFRNAIFNFFT